MLSNRFPRARPAKVMNIYKDNTFPLVLLFALSFNQLSTITNIPIILNPVKNLANVQITGSTNTTCTSELNDAIEAKAANTLIWPTLLTSLGIKKAPIKNPEK